MLEYVVKGARSLKNKSFFSQIMLLIVISVICIVLTVCIALLAGSCTTTLLDFENLNFANMIPVLVIGGFLSCVAVGVTALFVARAVFLKVKNYLSDNDGGDMK